MLRFFASMQSEEIMDIRYMGKRERSVMAISKK